MIVICIRIQKKVNIVIIFVSSKSEIDNEGNLLKIRLNVKLEHN